MFCRLLMYGFLVFSEWCRLLFLWLVIRFSVCFIGVSVVCVLCCVFVVICCSMCMVWLLFFRGSDGVGLVGVLSW